MVPLVIRFDFYLLTLTKFQNHLNEYICMGLSKLGDKYKSIYNFGFIKSSIEP